MTYQLSQHAEDALEKRRIPREWMERAFFRPDCTEPDAIDPELEHRLARIEEFQGRILRVIVNVKAGPPRVVTVYFDRGRKRQ